MRIPAFSRSTWLLIVLVGVKLALHFFTNTLYGLHRDEYLYMAEGEHLRWGYMEGPPMIAFLAKLAIILGKTEFTVRLLPALAGSLLMVLAVRLTGHLKGSFAAQVLVGMALLVSPALLGSNTLFQPVSFNQLGWMVVVYLLVRLQQTQKPRYWYLLGFAVGLGLLTKYSLAFWLLALALPFLLTKERHWLTTRHPYLAIAAALMMFLPNFLWQVNHHWPLLEHMRVLQERQLVNVTPANFLADQMMYQGIFLVLWISGLVGPWLVKSLSPLRWITGAYVCIVLLLLYLSGKSYYMLGAYPILMVLGALTWDHLMVKPRRLVIAGSVLVLLNLPLLPLAIPLLPLSTMVNYSKFLNEEVGLDGPFRWEDGVVRDLRQDYADMHGWEEMVQKVAELYHSLPPNEQATTQVYGGGYGHAGALNFYREKYDLPEAASFSASFVMWVSDEFPYTQQITVDDVWNGESPYFATVDFVDSIRHPWARDPGYIFFKRTPTAPLDSVWGTLAKEEKATWGF